MRVATGDADAPSWSMKMIEETSAGATAASIQDSMSATHFRFHVPHAQFAVSIR